ncbi:hypothetical protein ACSBR1_001589 [Camellia fascicularis]
MRGAGAPRTLCSFDDGARRSATDGEEKREKRRGRESGDGGSGDGSGGRDNHDSNGRGICVNRKSDEEAMTWV